MRSPLFRLIAYFEDPTALGATEGIVIMFFSLLSVYLILLPFHECAHALAARLLGDDTAELEGRLTLNPLRHIDPVGMGAMFLVGFGWAKPVPVNPARASRRVTMRGFISLTAAAGPLSNIIFAWICILASKISFKYGLAELYQSMVYQPYMETPMAWYFCQALFYIAMISVSLAVFNLIPIPPLDGSKILFFFLSNRQINFMERNMGFIRMAFLIVLMSTNVFSTIMNPVTDFIMKGLDFTTSFVVSYKDFL